MILLLWIIPLVIDILIIRKYDKRYWDSTDVYTIFWLNLIPVINLFILGGLLIQLLINSNFVYKLLKYEE